MPVRRSICHIILSVNTFKSYHPGGMQSAQSQAHHRLSQNSFYSAVINPLRFFYYSGV